MKIERRAIEGLKLKSRTIVGRPVVYNSRSEDLGGFVEVIAPFAFKDSMERDVRALIEHDHSKLIGRTSSRTMRMKEDEQGIYVEIDLPNNRTADELLDSIERRDITGMSFGFTVPPNGDKWSVDTEPYLRTVNKAILHEVTITALPAYAATDVSVAQRSLEGHVKQGYVDYIIENGVMFLQANKL